MKPIKKVAVTPIEPKTGYIFDTTNIDNKAENTYSANIIDGLVKEVYSTDEIVIGTWIDGKPIYRKVIHFVTSSELIGIPIGISNLERIVDFRGCADWFPINFTTFDNGTPYFVATQYRIEQGQIIHICSSEYANEQAYAIIEYTKTTD